MQIPTSWRVRRKVTLFVFRRIQYSAIVLTSRSIFRGPNLLCPLKQTPKSLLSCLRISDQDLLHRESRARILALGLLVLPHVKHDGLPKQTFPRSPNWTQVHWRRCLKMSGKKYWDITTAQPLTRRTRRQYQSRAHQHLAL